MTCVPIRTVILAALAAFTMVGAGSAPGAGARPSAAVRVVTLLADNSLVITPLRGPGRFTLPLGHYRRGKLGPPRGLAVGRLGGRPVVFALVDGQRDSRIVAVDPVAGTVVARYRLPAARRYAALVRVRQSLYAFGNDAKRRAIVVRAPLTGGVARTLFTGRIAFVYDGAVDARARFAVVSYHGARSTGADVVPLVPGAPSCLKGPSAFEGCLEVHGAVTVRHGLVLATGGGGARVVRLDGSIVRTIAVPMARNHFMAMAVGAGDTAVLPGSCGYGGGIATVNFATAAPHVVVRPPRRRSDQTFGTTVRCGDGVALGPGSLVAITQPSFPVPQPDGAGRVVVWQDWHVVARIAVRPDPVAVALVVQSPR
jgi:hypothetical protein